MKKKWLLTGVLVVLAAVVVALWLLFFRDDAPEAVSTEAGLEQLQEDLAATADDSDDAPLLSGDDTATDDTATDDTATEVEADPEPSDDQEAELNADQSPSGGPANGTWTVDDEFGDFDFETASGSFAGFRVEEELTVGEVTAVGRTGGVTGSLTIEDGTLAAAEITIDMTTIESNDGRRENAIRGAVGARDFPTATFVLTEPQPIDVAALEAGSTFLAAVVGDLTVKGTTNQVAFFLQATIVEPGIGLIIGSTEIFWEDFGITPPRAPIVVSVEDHGILEFQLVVRRG